MTAPLYSFLAPWGAARDRGVRPRLGQGTFRLAVIDAYKRCAITGEHSLPALEAAHIQPFSEDGPHFTSNGLLLRADLHRLFDKGYVTVDPDLRFHVSPRLREEYNNGRVYYELEKNRSSFHSTKKIIRIETFLHTTNPRSSWLLDVSSHLSSVSRSG